MQSIHAPVEQDRRHWLLDTAKPYLWSDDQIKRAINEVWSRENYEIAALERVF